MRIGAHVSPDGSLPKAVDNAVAAGCEALQVFVCNPRGWALPDADPALDQRFREGAALAGVEPVFVHVPYLVNFASTSEATWASSVSATAYCLRRGAAMGAGGVVAHAGSHLGGGRGAGLERTRAAVQRLLDAAPDGPDLVFELTAGAPNAIAARFDQMAELLAALDDQPRVKVCLDTCHAHAAGYDLSTTSGATAAVGELLAAVGPDRVVLVHANDTKEPRGARRDRHWHVGEGQIGDEGFAAVLAHPGLAGAAVITETPGETADHARNVARLKRLRAR